MLRYSYLSKHNATKWLLIASLCDELVDHLPLCSNTSKASQKWQECLRKGNLQQIWCQKPPFLHPFFLAPPPLHRPPPRHPPPPSCRHVATPVTSATSPPPLSPVVRAPVLFAFLKRKSLYVQKEGLPIV